MDIENLLISFMIDVYEQYCYYALDMTQDDFDSSFYDENGNDIDDRDYLIANCKKIFNDEMFEGLYEILSENREDETVDVNRIINFLTGVYFVYNYEGGNSSVIRYLKDASFESIKELFMNNHNFGVDLIKAYFYGLVDQERCQKNKDTIMENGDGTHMNRFFEQATVNNQTTMDFITLNDLLRNIVCDLYNHYIQNGCGNIEALNYTWQYFLKDFDPIGTLNQMGCDFKTKEIYKRYLLGLIISDLYEDVSNKSIIDSENEKDRLIQVIPIIAANWGAVCIPNDEELRNRMLKYFILLQDEKKKRKENRYKTYSDKRTQVLKKVNPFYQLDDISFVKMK